MFKIFYTNAQGDHLTEIVDGVTTVAPHPENPRRAVLIRDALVREYSTPVITPAAAGIVTGQAVAAIEAMHPAAYRAFLEKLCGELTAGEFFIPSGGVRNKLELATAPVRKQAGFYNFGGDTPVSRQTYAAAVFGVEAALAGVDALLAGDRIAFALCRPPGHHAELDRYGGFCFFGNAAIAADQLARRGVRGAAPYVPKDRMGGPGPGPAAPPVMSAEAANAAGTVRGANHHARVAVIDVDYHHGNGTQRLLFERFDTFYLSLHGDPRFAYPHFTGWGDEIGEGAGEGYNLNLPLPHDTDKAHYLATLETGLKAVQEFAPDYVIVSLGFDIHKNDPVGGLGLETDDFRDIALALKGLNRPTLVVLEGGYSEPDLGPSACAFFSAWA